MRLMLRHKKSRGFTLVELLVVMPIMIVSVSVLATFLITLYSQLLVTNGKLELESTAQNSLFTMRDDLFFTNRFAGNIQTDTTDSHAPSGGWNAVNHNALIMYEASYDKVRQDATRQLIYKRDTPHPCAAAEVVDNQFSTNTVIYFLSGTTLYRRVLIPNQTANCATTFRIQTCPAASATPACPADTIIAENVKTFSIAYYDREALVVSQQELADDPEDFIQVLRADLVLTLEKKISSETISSTAQITIKKAE